ncbi:MAG: endo-1,4-beta-xylanase [Oscillospiraceae bacterium]|nr:endo-1,4-beta-xylanase [Oscillospiraceae bacterium]
MSAYSDYLETGALPPSLAQTYDGLFSVGLSVTPNDLRTAKGQEILWRNFNSLTTGNEMKADFTMDYNATLKAGDETRVKLNLTRADKVLSFAQEHGMKMRGHTLVWHSQVPRWFFTAGYQNGKESPLAAREVILQRMENYIRDLMEYVNTTYPGLVYAWDVVNEAIEPANGHENGYRTQNNLWYETLGDDFIELAFTFARKYAEPSQKLFYNDYNEYEKNKLFLILNLLKDLQSKGLVDGMGMQAHIGIDQPLTAFEEAMTMYGALGLEVHVTELDIKIEDGSVVGRLNLAVKYKRLFSMFKRLKEKGIVDVTNVTIWGVLDSDTWLNYANGGGHTYYPLLFDGDYAYKAAYFGALLDEAIPISNTEEALREAAVKLGLAD